VKALRSTRASGFSRAERKLVFMAGVEVDLAPWETLYLPNAIADELVARSKGGLAEYWEAAPKLFIHPYQVKVRLSCP